MACTADKLTPGTLLRRILYWALQWTWGAIQNALGLMLWIALRIAAPKAKRWWYHGAAVTNWTAPGSMGLGMFVFYGHAGRTDAAQVLVHEYGHTLQSCVLGPLFLLVIGIPSFLWANLPACKNRRARGVRYSSFYPEYWANKWGERALKRPAVWD